MPSPGGYTVGGKDYTYGSRFGVSSSGALGASWFDWLNFAANIYKSRQDSKVKSVPLTPEQKRILAMVESRLGSLPDTNSAVARMALGRLGSAPELDMDALRRGETGAYKPPGKMSEAELSNILRGTPTTTTTPTTTPTTITPATGGGVSGGGIGAVPFDRGGVGQGAVGGGTLGGHTPYVPPATPRGRPPAGIGSGIGQHPPSGFAAYLESKGVADAAKMAADFFGKRLTGVMLATITDWWRRYLSGK